MRVNMAGMSSGMWANAGTERSAGGQESVQTREVRSRLRSTDSLEEFEEPKVRKLVEQSRRNYDNAKKQIENTWNYGDQLKAARGKNQKTDLQVKQLRYNFKSISTKILRSKTSYTAKLAASEAKREVMRLKRLRGDASYDEDELQMAIDHAKRMERVAKKKVHHLEEEEMLKSWGGPCLGVQGEQEEDENRDEADAEEMNEEASDVPMSEALTKEQMSDLPVGASEMMQQEMTVPQMRGAGSLMQAAQKLSGDVEDVIDELSEEMKELLEDMGLGELLELQTESEEEAEDPAGYHMMKLKHRNSEMKDMAKADGEYLKALFDQLEKEHTAMPMPMEPAIPMEQVVPLPSGGFEAFV